jgi:hypothetical protein
MYVSIETAGQVPIGLRPVSVGDSDNGGIPIDAIACRIDQPFVRR